jgi:hypothetical protein
MDDEQFDKVIAIQAHAARDKLALAQAENAARNGRLFCILIVAVAVAALMTTRDLWFGKLAVVAASPAGVACIVDHMPMSKAKAALALISYSVSASTALALLLSLG